MQWDWKWFAAGIGGLLGLGLVRGLLKILTPVAVVGVGGYGIATFVMRRRRGRQTRLPAAAPESHLATR